MEHTTNHERPASVTSGATDRPAARHAGAALSFDLGSELERLRAESTYQSSDRNARTLVKEERLRVVLTTSKAGARLDEHRAPGPVTIQGVDGMPRVQAEGQTVELPPGRIVSARSHRLAGSKRNARGGGGRGELTPADDCLAPRRACRIVGEAAWTPSVRRRQPPPRLSMAAARSSGAYPELRCALA